MSNNYIREYMYRSIPSTLLFQLLYYAFSIAPYFGSSVSVQELFFSMTRGFSYQNFNLIEFLLFAIYMLFPLFLLNAFWENEKNNRNEIAKLRVGSNRRWQRTIQSEGRKGIIQYNICTLLIMAGLLLVALFFCHADGEAFIGMLMEWYSVSAEAIYLCFAVAALGKGLELLLLYELSYFVFRITKQTVASFMSVFVFYAIGFADVKWFPLGSSSVYQLLETAGEYGNEGIWCSAALLAVAWLGMVILNIGLNYWRKKGYGEVNGRDSD